MLRLGLIVLVAVLILGGVFVTGYVVGKRADQATVPNLIGLGTDGGGQAVARRTLEPYGLRLGRVYFLRCAADEAGVIVKQVPSAGTVVPTGATVDIAVGTIGGSITPGGGQATQCLPGIQQPAG